MSSQQTNLGIYEDCTKRVSPEVQKAVAGGKIRAYPFVDFTNTAYRTALGLRTVMELLYANRIDADAVADGCDGQPMFSSNHEGYLLGLAEVALEMLANEADGCAAWAEACLKEREGQS